MSTRSTYVRGALLVVLAACGGSAPAPQPAGSAPSAAGGEAAEAPELQGLVAEEAPDLEAAREPAAAPEPFRIATWNIENLSRNKLADADRAAAIVAILREFDVVAVEELSDSLGPELLDALNAAEPLQPDETRMLWQEIDEIANG